MNSTNTLKYIISIVCSILLYTASAQDTIKRQEFIRLNAEISGIGTYLISDITRYDASVMIDAEYRTKYFPIVELGWNKTIQNTENFNYTSQGLYSRVGLNYNLLKLPTPGDRSALFFGGRYAISSFEQTVTDVNYTGEWTDYKNSYNSPNLYAHWAELVIGMQGEVANNLFLGYTIRLKRKIAFSDFGQHVPYVIPGFGRASRNGVFGFNYYIAYAFPVKKLFPAPNPNRKPLFKKKEKPAFKQKTPIKKTSGNTNTPKRP